MRLAFATIFDARDVRNWSGTYLHMWRALERQGFEITLIGNLRHGRSAGRRLRKLASRATRRSHLHFWDISTARGYAADSAERLAACGADVVLSPTPVPLAFLETPIPKVLWTDAGMVALRESYPEFARGVVSAWSYRHAEAVDRAAAENVDLQIYASQWGAQAAEREHAAARGRTLCVPYGGNLTEAPPPPDVEARLADPVLRLLFVGVEWERKGAAKACRLVGELNARGRDARLTIVGCRPPAGASLPPGVEVVGFVAKDTEAGRRQLDELYRRSHFLVVPTLAEAYGLVFAEASAFGVPSLSHRLDGVPTVVCDGVNGQLFDPEQDVSAWADWLLEHCEPAAYRRLVQGCLDQYRDRLNWSVAAGRVAREIRSRFGEPRAAANDPPNGSATS